MNSDAISTGIYVQNTHITTYVFIKIKVSLPRDDDYSFGGIAPFFAELHVYNTNSLFKLIISGGERSREI